VNELTKRKMHPSSFRQLDVRVRAQAAPRRNKMAKKQKQLPEVIFVAREEEGTENEYLRIETDAKAIADLQEDKIVGTYKLVEQKTLTTVVKWRE
jgi:hypothetical protein